MNVGELLKAYREKNHLTQQAVANYLNIKREVLSYYENNIREAPLEILEKIADLYGIELADLFESDPDQNHTNVAFAFRAEGIEEADFKELASFRKAVKNYLKICEIEKKNG